MEEDNFMFKIKMSNDRLFIMILFKNLIKHHFTHILVITKLQHVIIMENNE